MPIPMIRNFGPNMTHYLQKSIVTNGHLSRHFTNSNATFRRIWGQANNMGCLAIIGAAVGWLAVRAIVRGALWLIVLLDGGK